MILSVDFGAWGVWGASGRENAKIRLWHPRGPPYKPTGTIFYTTWHRTNPPALAGSPKHLVLTHFYVSSQPSTMQGMPALQFSRLAKGGLSFSRTTPWRVRSLTRDRAYFVFFLVVFMSVSVFSCFFLVLSWFSRKTIKKHIFA